MKPGLELVSGGVGSVVDVVTGCALGTADPTARAALGAWNDVVLALRRAALEMQKLGEHRQAEALITDAQSMVRRAQLHLRSLGARGAGETEI
jgi:TRAP-type mannitol/chloroaromatic compound transport system permease large subunit